MKLFRTYINGSKKNELTLFNQLLGDNINWVEYLKYFEIFSSDIINTYKSRYNLISMIINSLIFFAIVLVILQTFSIFIYITLIMLVFVKYSLSKKLYRLELLNKFTIEIIKNKIDEIYCT